MKADLLSWGYSRKGNIVGLRCALAEALLVSRSLHLADLEAETLDRLYRDADAKIIRILAPMMGTRKKKDTEKSKDPAVTHKPVLVGFRTACVFDISPTEGAALPEFTGRTTGEVGEFRERLTNFTIAQGITLEFKESIAPALGLSYGGRIVLLPGQAPAEEFSTLVHELAHEMLHKAERRTATTKTVRETEAEAVTFVVSQTIGLDAGRASADYIHLYHGNAALLTESLELIQKTSALILSAIETAPAAEQNDTTEAVAEVAQCRPSSKSSREPGAGTPASPSPSTTAVTCPW